MTANEKANYSVGILGSGGIDEVLQLPVPHNRDETRVSWIAANMRRASADAASRIQAPAASVRRAAGSD